MSFSTYGGLKTAIADWLGRSDLSDAVLSDFVTLATATLNKSLRAQYMVWQVDIPITAGVRFAAAPADMREPLFVTIANNEDYPLEQASPQRIGALRRSRFLSPGQPRFYCAAGPRIELCPTPLTSTILEVGYYRALTALSAAGATNPALENDPDAYLYASLLHAAQYLHDDALQLKATAVLKDLLGVAIDEAGRGSRDEKAS